MNISEEEKDVLTEVVNIGVGRAAASLSELVGERIILTVPSAIVCTLDELPRHIRPDDSTLDVAITQDFAGDITGRAMLAFPRSSGIKLGQILGGLDETHDRLDVDLTGILEEVGNIVLNGVLGSIANILETGLSYSVPQLTTDVCVEEIVAQHASEQASREQSILLADTRFDIASRQISGSLILAFSLQSVEMIIRSALRRPVA